MKLSGGGEDDFYFGCKEFLRDKGLDHFVISAGVENARLSIGEKLFAEFGELAKCEFGGIIGNVMLAENSKIYLFF